MHSLAWWPIFAVLLLATVIDLRTRRIPNWLVLPLMVSGLAARWIVDGLPGLGRSLAGIGLALLLFGFPCFIGAMGMGDLKLAAGVAAWIGPMQFLMAFIVTGMVGGVMAVGYALHNRALGRCLDNAGELVVHLVKGRVPAHADVRSQAARAISIPYAPAIAIGTLFSFWMR